MKENEKENKIIKKQKQMYNWSFVRLPYCVSFLRFCGVFETVPHPPLPPSCTLSLSNQSHDEASCIKGGANVPVQIALDWESSRGGTGLAGFCSSTLNSVGKGERPFSVSSLFLISGDVFSFFLKFPILMTQF